MARIRDYTQYEGYPFGYGEFELDDGSKIVLDDPERARKLLEERDGEQGTLGGSIARETNDLLGRADDRYENAVGRVALGPNAAQRAVRPRLERPDPMRGAVAGPGGGDGLMSAEDDGPNQSTGEPATIGGPPPAAPLTEEALQERTKAEEGARLLASVPTHRRVPGVDPERMQREGKPVDQSFMRQGGLPTDLVERQKADREQQYAGTNDVLTTVQNENLAAREAETQRLRAEAQTLKDQNDKRDLELQRRSVQYQTDRAALEKEVDDYYDRSKPDPDGGLRKARGPIGNIASAIAQFMGAYAAIISGSPNFANQILNKKIDSHVDAQIEEFKRGKMKRDGQLQRMAERGMSIEQMKSALKLQQELYIQKEAETRAYVEGTRESKAAFQTLMADRAERKLGLEQAFEKEALGKETVSGAFVQPKAGGLVPLTPLERIEQGTKLKNAGSEFAYALGGGKHAEDAEGRAYQRTKDAEDRADKRDERQQKQNTLTEAQGKAESAHHAVTDLGNKAGLVRGKDGKWTVGGGAVPPALLQKAGETASLGLYQGDIGAAFDAAVEAFGRQQSGGVIGKDERPAFEAQLGKSTMSRQQLADRLNAAELNIEAKRKKDLDDIRNGTTNALPGNWSR